MNNPFDVIEKRLSSIEELLLDLKHKNNDSNQLESGEQLLTIDEAAKFLHLRKPTLYTKHSRGELPGVCKKNGRLYFSKQALIDWIKSGMSK